MNKKITSKEKMLSEFSSKEKSYIQFGEMMLSLMTRLLRLKNIQTHSIQYRIKDSKSLGKKIEDKKKYNSLDEITDILGLRIITYYSEDIKCVEEILKENFIIDEENTIDKRNMHEVDRFGYMSLHYIISLNENRHCLAEYKDFQSVKFEIQIRTILQHSWAEIEHDLGYKTINSVPSHIKRKFAILSGTLEMIDEQFLEIKRAINEYRKEIKIDIKKEDGNLLNNDDSINDIFLSNFFENSKLFNSAYKNYLKARGCGPIDESEGLNESFVWFIYLLSRIKINKVNEFIHLMNEVFGDEKLTKIFYEFDRDWSYYLNFPKNIYFLFTLYAYIYREKKTNLIDRDDFVDAINKVGEYMADMGYIE
ncbi:hypothetical protein QDQ59_06275 [Providencia rettgeri]|uniref:GTP pyrophosphokinase n=1 Tax=Providencia rettgeri TaxID=587 RepID=UPI0024482F46|nr:hypothetical protein [Providencia rettgeri]MDH2369457.1 hypothetical protein [Providencia rettgeri]